MIVLLLVAPACGGSSEDDEQVVDSTTSSSLTEAESANRDRAASMADDGCDLVPSTGEMAAATAHQAATYVSAASAFDERFSELRDALIAYDQHLAGETPLAAADAEALLDDIRAMCA